VLYFFTFLIFVAVKGSKSKIVKHRPADFIKAHLSEVVAADFFTVEILRPFGLVRYYVLFIIDIQTRRVQIAGIVHQPYEEWMKQIARKLTDAFDSFLRGKRYFIHDRDPMVSDAFRRILRDSRYFVGPMTFDALSKSRSLPFRSDIVRALRY
jgi:hypothetical protein